MEERDDTNGRRADDRAARIRRAVAVARVGRRQRTAGAGGCLTGSPASGPTGGPTWSRATGSGWETRCLLTGGVRHTVHPPQRPPRERPSRCTSGAGRTPSSSRACRREEHPTPEEAARLAQASFAKYPQYGRVDPENQRGSGVLVLPTGQRARVDHPRPGRHTLPLPGLRPAAHPPLVSETARTGAFDAARGGRPSRGGHGVGPEPGEVRRTVARWSMAPWPGSAGCRGRGYLKGVARLPRRSGRLALPGSSETVSERGSRRLRPSPDRAGHRARMRQGWANAGGTPMEATATLGWAG